MATLKYDLDLDVKDALKSLGKFNKGLKATDKNFKEVDKGTKGLTKTFGGLKTALVGVVGSLGLGALIKASLDSADALGKVANKTGFTVKSLQELRYAANQAGISSKTLDTSLQRFSRRVGEAANGTGVLRKDLNKMNIAIKNSDGSMRNIDAVFTEYTDGIRNATSAQEKLRLSVAAFDMEGANMVNMLGDTEAAFAATAMEATKLGIILDKNLIKKATESNDAWSKVKQQMAAISIMFSAELAPALKHVADALSLLLSDKEFVLEIAQSFRKFGEAIIWATDNFKYLFDIAKSFVAIWVTFKIGKLIGFFKSFGDSFRYAGNKLKGLKGGLSKVSKLFGIMRIPLLVLTSKLVALGVAVKVVTEFLFDFTGSLQKTAAGLNWLTMGIGPIGGFFDEWSKKLKILKQHNLSLMDLFGGEARFNEEGKLIVNGIERISGKIDGIIKPRVDVTSANETESVANSMPTQGLDDFKSKLKETAMAFLPLKQAEEDFILNKNKIGDALVSGVISQEEYNTALANMTNEYNKFKASIQGPELNAHIKQWKEYQNTIKATASQYTPVITQQKKFAKTAKELKDAFKSGILTQKQYAIATKNLNKEIKAFNRAQLGQSTAWSDGWKRAFQDYADDARDAASTAERLFKTATQGMEDAIVGFAKTGKFEWKSFVNSMLEELLRSQIRSLFAKLMGGLTSTLSSSTASMTQSVGAIGGSGGSSNPIGQIFGGSGSASGGECVKLCSGSAKEIGEAVGEGQGGILDGITGALSGVWDGITGSLGSAGDWMGDIFGGITDGAGSVWDGVTGVLGDGATGIWDGITGSLGSAGDWMGDIFGDITDGATGIWDGVTGVLGDGATGIWDGVKDIFSGDGLLGDIGGGIGSAVDGISDIFSGGTNIIDDITGAFGGLFGGSGSNGKVVVEGMSSLEDYINGGGIGGGIDGSSKPSNVGGRRDDGIFSSIGSLFGDTGQQLGGLADSVFGGGESELDKRRRESRERSAQTRAANEQTNSNRQSSSSNYLSQAWEGVKNIGSSVGGAVSGAWDTVKSVGSGAWDVVKDIGSGIGDFFGGFFADGGSLPAGKFGIVGENGPELISGPANITPNGAFGGNTNLTVTINAVDAPSFQQLVARDPGFIAAVAMQGTKQFQGGF